MGFTILEKSFMNFFLHNNDTDNMCVSNFLVLLFSIQHREMSFENDWVLYVAQKRIHTMHKSEAHRHRNLTENRADNIESHHCSHSSKTYSSLKYRFGVEHWHRHTHIVSQIVQQIISFSIRHYLPVEN